MILASEAFDHGSTPETPSSVPGPPVPIIVGIGASAGGLQALQRFFERMPFDARLAFVVITHQPEGTPNRCTEQLRRRTDMRVVEVTGPTPVEPGHVYTVQPGFRLAIEHGVLQLVAPNHRGILMPVDYFFRSLARDQKARAIGIVLSGCGRDGTIGLREIKDQLGVALVQTEDSAQYPEMPRSAIGAQLADQVLPVEQMPAQLLAHVDAKLPKSSVPALRPVVTSDPRQQILATVRAVTGADFSHYKPQTITNRIQRRMNVRHLATLEQYRDYLLSTPSEAQLLFHELLIRVTSFFRDPEAWRALARVVSDLLATKPDGYVLRAWVAGCSTGQEVYSLAILLRECIDASGRPLSFQIFATELDPSAIQHARAGTYPLGIAHELGAERVQKFFFEFEGGYRIKQDLRDRIAFGPHNLLVDPPFMRLDLVSCRNVLIYFDATLQRQVLPLFHRALSRDGLLFLGKSESVGSFGDLFARVDTRFRIYQRREPALTGPARKGPANGAK